MSGILRLESLTKGNTLKQGDKTALKYRLFDADGEQLDIAGKSAKVRLVYPDFLTIGYEKDGLTVAQDDTVTFTIDSIIPSRIYHVEIIVDDQFIFPSRSDEAKFTVDKSSLGTETNIIEIVGVDQIVNTVLGRVDADISQAVTDITTTNEAIQQAEQERVQGYQEIQQIIEDGALSAVPLDGSVTPIKTSFARISKNLHNVKTTKENTTVDGNGEETPSVEYALSDFIPVEGSGSYVSNFNVAIQKYGAEKNRVGGLMANSTSHTMTSLTRFVRIRMSNSDIDKIQFEKGGLSTPFQPYGLIIDDLVLPEVVIPDLELPDLIIEPKSILEEHLADEIVSPEKTTFLKRSINLYDPNTSEDYMHIDVDGTPTSSLERTLSDYIPVDGNTTYVSSHSCILRTYDSNKNPIGGNRGSGPSSPVTTTSLTRYVRVTPYISDKNKFQLEKGSVPTMYIPHGGLAIPRLSGATSDVVDIDLDLIQQMVDNSTSDIIEEHLSEFVVSPENTTFIEKSRNLHNAETTKENTTVDSNGEEIPSLEYALSDFIPVTGSESYVSNINVAVQKYDEDKNKLGNLVANSTSHIMTSLTRFVRIRMYNSEVDKIQFEKGELSTPFQPYGEMSIPNLSMQNKLIAGDNITIEGDTISAEVPEIDLQPVYDSINSTSENATQALSVANQAQDKADNVQTQISTLVIEGDSSAESAQSRVDKSGYTYNTLKERMDAEQISINLASRGLSPSNSASANTAILQQAVIDAESIRGTLILPDVPIGQWIEIDDAIFIESGHIKILGSMQNSRIKQTTYPKAIFDINAPYVTVDGMFGSGVEFTAHNTGTYRGHMEKSYYTSVAVYANDVHVKNIKSDNLINGVFFYGWDSVNNVNKNIVNNSIENLEVSNVDFGFSASYVTDFNFHNVKGSHRQMPGSGTPPHLVYVVGSTPGINKNVTGSMLRPHDGNDAHAIKISGTKNGNITDIVSERSFGSIWTQDNEDVTFDGVHITDEKFDLNTQSVIEFWGNNTRVEVKNVNVEIPTNAKAFRLPKTGIDNKLTNIRIVTNYTEETQTLSAPVDIQGTGTILENITVENSGPLEWLASIHLFEAFDTTIINPKTSGNKNGIYFRSGDGLLLRYYARALGSQENYVVQSGATDLRLSTAE